MNSALLFEFTVSKENNTIHIKRAFDAPVPLVWKAWTTAELLDQWWGPQPWRAETKSMDFREGGYWLYAMVSPEGSKHWARADYMTIIKERSFTAKDGFCDEQGNLNPSFPQNIWENQFRASGDQTVVDVTLRFDRLEDLEQTIAMGFREGFTKGLQQLDALLPQLKN